MKNNIRKLVSALLLFLFCTSIIPVVLAKTRQSHIIDFIYENQNSDETFGTTPQETAYALEIINHYDSYVVNDFIGIKYKVDKELLIDNLTAQIQGMFNIGKIDIYDLYYLLKSLSILGSLEELLSVYLHNRIYSYINGSFKVGGGFSSLNTSQYANVISTYFIYNIYDLINEPFLNATLHRDWILSCNNTDGGYGGNQTLSSTLLTTLHAIYLIDKLGASLENQTKTLDYLGSLFINDPSNFENYGGYLPDVIATRALLHSTYHCVESIRMIDPTLLKSKITVNWVLGLQNFQDGGFTENLDIYEQKLSSIKATYYAFMILSSFAALDRLNEDIFMVEFNFILLIIVLSIVGVVIAIMYYIWRKRRI